MWSSTYSLLLFQSSEYLITYLLLFLISLASKTTASAVSVGRIKPIAEGKKSPKSIILALYWSSVESLHPHLLLSYRTLCSRAIVPILKTCLRNLKAFKQQSQERIVEKSKPASSTLYELVFPCRGIYGLPVSEKYPDAVPRWEKRNGTQSHVPHFSGR